MRIGRPRKYTHIIDALEEDEIYSPGAIVRFAEEKGLLDDYFEEESNKKLVRQRIRISCIRLSEMHQFPAGGDALVTIKGQAPTPGWYGWRWKQSLL